MTSCVNAGCIQHCFLRVLLFIICIAFHSGVPGDDFDFNFFISNYHAT